MWEVKRVCIVLVILASFLILQCCHVLASPCPVPLAPQHGQMQLSHNQQLVRFQCDPGFQLVGKDMALCLTGPKRWSHPPPRCNPEGVTYMETKPELAQNARLFRAPKLASGDNMYARVRQLSHVVNANEEAEAKSDELDAIHHRSLFTWETRATTGKTVEERLNDTIAAANPGPSGSKGKKKNVSDLLRQLKTKGEIRSNNVLDEYGEEGEEEEEDGGEEDNEEEVNEDENYDEEEERLEEGGEEEGEEEEGEPSEGEEDGANEEEENPDEEEEAESSRTKEKDSHPNIRKNNRNNNSVTEKNGNAMKSSSPEIPNVVDEDEEDSDDVDTPSSEAPKTEDAVDTEELPVKTLEDSGHSDVAEKSVSHLEKPGTVDEQVPLDMPKEKHEDEEGSSADASPNLHRLVENQSRRFEDLEDDISNEILPNYHVMNVPIIRDNEGSDRQEEEEDTEEPDQENSIQERPVYPLDYALLDVSCTLTREAVPDIANAVVSKYGRSRSASLPYNLFMEVIYECKPGFELATASHDRLYCSQKNWIGDTPFCTPIGDVDVDAKSNGTVRSSETSFMSTCGPDRGDCEHVCRQSGELDYECACFRGFRLHSDKKSCIDIDECAVENGGCEFGCTNRPGGFQCSCPTGFRLASNGKRCIDQNECSSRNGHGPCQGTCRNTVGSYVCSCEDLPGTRLGTDKHSCEDIDECANNVLGCSHSCINSMGAAFCACPEGYMLGEDWKTCEDIDECDVGEYDEGKPCANSCKNTIGSYLCMDEEFAGPELVTCPTGWVPNLEGSCQDVDECLNNNFGCSHVCHNVNGSAYCSCPSGYELGLGNKTCVDVNECLQDNGGCSDVCVNVVGSVHCSCPSGFALMDDWKTCSDLDECALENGEPLCKFSSCQNTPGAFECNCWTGYIKNDQGECSDVDECAIDGQCINGHCQNNPGSFACTCFEGYESRNDTYCQDIDECIDRPCINGRCSNSQGSFECSCEDGFKLEDRLICTDIDECERNPCRNGECVNVPGSYQCLCQTGYELENDTCIDVNECLVNPCSNGSCINTEGSFRCECPSGFSLANNTCYDIDECVFSSCINGDCINVPGSYRCECHLGFEALDSNCYDVDECSSSPCTNGICINTEGSFICQCPSGFRMSGLTCYDVDECLQDPCIHGHCINTRGSYYCQCPPGYALQEDLHTCQDINECLVDNGGCEHHCINTVGSFHCDCPTGYVPDSNNWKKCRDIDECAIFNGGCSHICRNQPGAHLCECRLGFLLAADQKSCLEVPAKVVNYCSAFDPPTGGYLYCSTRPGPQGYKPGTACQLKCKKGYQFDKPRHSKPTPSTTSSESLNSLNKATENKKDAPADNEASLPSLAGNTGWRQTRIWKGHWEPVSTSTIASTSTVSPKTGVNSVQEALSRGWSTGNGRHKKVLSEHKKRAATRATRSARREEDLVINNEATVRIRGPARRCGEDGKWKGKLGACKAATCPPLEKPRNGTVMPLQCQNGEAWTNLHCYFTCDRGYRVVGNPLRVCSDSFQWTPFRSGPICEKVTVRNSADSDNNNVTSNSLPAVWDWELKPSIAYSSLATNALPSLPSSSSAQSFRNYIHFSYVYPWPRIECPHDMVVDLPVGKKTAAVYIPQPVTNVDWTKHVEAEPAWAKHLQVELGPSRTVVSFRARNPASDYTAICSFVLEIRDKEVPLVRDCPHHLHVRLSPAEPYVAVSWQEPVFSDNVGIAHIIKNKEPGSLFPVGQHPISYVASDLTGNKARCDFVVHVAPALVPDSLYHGEACPVLESPQNGQLSCKSWTWGKMCRPSCSPSHVFFRPLPSAVYLCGKDKRWKPANIIPDCSPSSIIPESGCPEGWEERRTGTKQCVGCSPGLYRPVNSTVCIPCPMGTYQDSFAGSVCKPCPKKTTTCSLGARQCTDCKAPEDCNIVIHSSVLPSANHTSSSPSSVPQSLIARRPRTRKSRPRFEKYYSQMP